MIRKQYKVITRRESAESGERKVQLTIVPVVEQKESEEAAATLPVAHEYYDIDPDDAAGMTVGTVVTLSIESTIHRCRRRSYERAACPAGR
jgi:hypothetical protein